MNAAAAGAITSRRNASGIRDRRTSSVRKWVLCGSASSNSARKAVQSPSCPIGTIAYKSFSDGALARTMAAVAAPNSVDAAKNN